MGGAIGVEDAPAVDLHKDQHVERLKQHGLDSEEIAGKDGPGVGAQELSPGRTVASRSRRYAMTPEQASDSSRRDLVSELEQFALDAAIAPARVLAGQAQYQ